MANDAARSIDVVLTELAQAPSMIRAQVPAIWDTVQALLDEIDVTTTPRVVLTGCGDSLYAGMAARWAFERYGGVAAEAIEAIDFARYAVDGLAPKSLVLPISYSGQVARTIEAARNAEHFGATVVAITGRPERGLGQTAPRHLHVQVPSLGFSLGTSTYIGLMLAAYILAIGIGRRRGVLTDGQVAELLEALTQVGDLAEQALGAGDAMLPAQAAWLAERESVVFLGAGPHYASALFGAAKLFEGAQLHGVPQNTEEWAHAQYFISGPDTRTVLLAPRGRSLERAFEIATEMRFIETPFLVITDDAPERWQALTPRVLALPAGIREPFSPLLFAVPLSQLGYHLARVRGKQSYNFPSAEREREHYQTLHESKFRDLGAVDEG
jgi:glucosamine 6-phosphate synthetase-like amidotransferase/phosphosugar isomerase protein